MNTVKKAWSTRTLRWLSIVAILAVVVGFVLVLISVGMEWHGFGGGFAVGAGVGLMVVGSYFWGYSSGLRKPTVSGAWRPSEGEPR